MSTFWIVGTPTIVFVMYHLNDHPAQTPVIIVTLLLTIPMGIYYHSREYIERDEEQ
jgi:hypothetical protein